MSDKCRECGSDWGHLPSCSMDRPLAVENSRLKAEVSALRAKLSEMARLAEDTRLNVEAITGVGGWRPIETAPKDGTNILLREGSDVSQGGWLTGMAQGAEDEHYAGWWSVNCFDNPTHWMPLPQPPKEDDDERQVPEVWS